MSFSVVAEVCEHHIVKHPACQPHITGCPQANQEMNIIQEIQDRKNQTLIPLDSIGGFPCRSRSKKMVNRSIISAPEIAGILNTHLCLKLISNSWIS